MKKYFILVIGLLLLLPTVVFAETDVGVKVNGVFYDNLNTAYQNANDNDEMEIVGEVIVNSASQALTTVSTKEVTLTGSGTIKRGSSFRNTVITVSNNSKLNMKGSFTIDGNNTGSDNMILNEGTLSIDGITIKNHISSLDVSAIYNTNTLTVSNSTFDNNKAISGSCIQNYNDRGKATLTVTNSSFSNSTSSYGGAIFADGIESITNISNSTFTGNSATDGGAIIVANDEGDSVITIENTSFSKNKATGDGGAILVAKGASAEINKSTFDENTARHGGALGISESGSYIITETDFTKNEAYYGGAIYNEHGTLEISKSNFISNSSTGMGGAISTVYGNNTIEDSLFDKNTSVIGGALSFTSSSNTTEIKNTSFTNNEGTNGGAIYNGSQVTALKGSLLTITDSTFVGNIASKGAAIYNGDDKPGADRSNDAVNEVFINTTTFSSNTASSGADIYNQKGIGSETYSDTNINIVHIVGGEFTNKDNQAIYNGDVLEIDSSSNMGSVIYLAADRVLNIVGSLDKNISIYLEKEAADELVVVNQDNDIAINNSNYINIVNGSYKVKVEDDKLVLVEEEKIPDDDEPPVVDNPDTNDSVLQCILILIISSLGMALSIMSLTRKNVPKTSKQ